MGCCCCCLAAKRDFCSCCPKCIDPEKPFWRRAKFIVSAMLFVCGIAEIIGLFVYLDVFSNATAVGCCGIISTTDTAISGSTCLESAITDGTIDTMIIGGNRICAIGTEPCGDDTLSTCFANLNRTNPAVVGTFNMSSLCADDSVYLEDEEDAAVQNALFWIVIGLIVLFISSFAAIGECMSYCGCINCFKCCSKCCQCNVYIQFWFWLVLFVATQQYVEDPADEGYRSSEWSGSASAIAPVTGAAAAVSSADLGDAVQAACGLESFLWLDYDIDELPDTVASTDYQNVAALGLAFSIIEFAIGIAMHHCATKKDDDDDDKNDVEMAGQTTTATVR